MYSGLLVRKGSGKLLGTHQHINRITRRKLQPFIPHGFSFPTSRAINNFEGLNGPDGAKRKDPKNEERHFLDSENLEKTEIFNLIKKHRKNLINSLKAGDKIKSAKSAAWLSHALVDGLTPAHHFPLDEKYESLGVDLDDEKIMFLRILTSGDRKRDGVKNAWKVFGKKGLMTNHMLFELSVAYTTRNLKFKKIKLSRETRKLLREADEEIMLARYKLSLEKVFELNLYEDFCKNGWSRELFRKLRHKLFPIIITTVLEELYFALIKSQ